MMAMFLLLDAILKRFIVVFMMLEYYLDSKLLANQYIVVLINKL